MHTYSNYVSCRRLHPTDLGQGGPSPPPLANPAPAGPPSRLTLAGPFRFQGPHPGSPVPPTEGVFWGPPPPSVALASHLRAPPPQALGDPGLGRTEALALAVGGMAGASPPHFLSQEASERGAQSQVL